MKILVMLRDTPGRGILVRLREKTLQKEVRSLVNRSLRSRAMVTALTRGSFEEEVFAGDAAHLDADLILSEDRASWNLS